MEQKHTRRRNYLADLYIMKKTEVYALGITLAGLLGLTKDVFTEDLINDHWQS